MALVYIDLDSLKVLNDSEGHLSGDKCLMMISKELTRVARRPADVVARIGGEEFVLLLPETDLARAVQVVPRQNYELLVNEAFSVQLSMCPTPTL